APVARRVTDAHQHGDVALPRLVERVPAPRPPLDGVVRVCAQVRTGGRGEQIRHVPTVSSADPAHQGARDVRILCPGALCTQDQATNVWWRGDRRRALLTRCERLTRAERTAARCGPAASALGPAPAGRARAGTRARPAGRPRTAARALCVLAAHGRAAADA